MSGPTLLSCMDREGAAQGPLHPNAYGKLVELSVQPFEDRITTERNEDADAFGATSHEPSFGRALGWIFLRRLLSPTRAFASFLCGLVGILLLARYFADSVYSDFADCAYTGHADLTRPHDQVSSSDYVWPARQPSLPSSYPPPPTPQLAPHPLVVPQPAPSPPSLFPSPSPPTPQPAPHTPVVPQPAPSPPSLFPSPSLPLPPTVPPPSAPPQQPPSCPPPCSLPTPPSPGIPAHTIDHARASRGVAQCDAALKSPDGVFHQMWAPDGWRRRRWRAEACLGDWDGDAYWEAAIAGTVCDSNWYEGAIKRPDYEAPAPAVFGFDGAIDQYCAKACKDRGFADCNPDDSPHTCVKANMNMLYLVGEDVRNTGHGYNLCRNLEWQICAATSSLPGQQSSGLVFAHPPRELNLAAAQRCAGFAPLGCQSGYGTNQIFYLEVCIMTKLCRNKENVFELRVGEEFHCDFSADGARELQRILTVWN